MPYPNAYVRIFYGLKAKSSQLPKIHLFFPVTYMKLKFFVFIIIIFILSQTKTYASISSSKSSAFFTKEPEAEVDNRVRILRSFLERYNSPLVSSVEILVETADEYDLDWRFVAAISGVESTFGHQIPPGSYNAWGWGVYGTNVHYFSSWEEGIRTISRGLREDYINRWGAQNIYQIGAFYAASPTWAQRVGMYMNSIGSFSTLNPSESLSISL